jgi:hypothetical protein
MGQLHITPGVGIGPIRLGMHPHEVAAVFGEQQVYEKWMGGNLNDAILFHGLVLSFDKCDGKGPLASSRLDWIIVYHREDAYLFGRPMTDWGRNELFGRLNQEGFAPEPTEYGCLMLPDNTTMSFDENDRLIELIITPAGWKKPRVTLRRSAEWVVCTVPIVITLWLIARWTERGASTVALIILSVVVLTLGFRLLDRKRKESRRSSNSTLPDR